MRLAVAIFLLNISPLMLLSHAYGQPQKGPGKAEQKQTQTASDEPRSANAVDGHQEQRHDSESDKAKENPYVPWYKKPEWIAVVLTGIYVGITGWYVVVSHRTLNQISRQGDSIINAERAWIIVEMEWAEPRTSNIPRVQQFRRTDGTTVPLVRLRLIMRNSGKTPAWVGGTWVRHEISESFPPHPKLEPRGEPETGPEPVAAGGSTKDIVNLECPGLSIPTNRGDTVVIYGVAEYVDCFGAKRFTRFGYTLKTNGALDRIPDDAYNLFT